MVAREREDQITVEEYRRVSDLLESAGVPVELEEGRLIRRVSTKAWHSSIAGTFHTLIESHLLSHDLPGVVTGETTGYQAADDDCPEPGVAYCPTLDYALDTPCIPPEYPPALVIEIVSNPCNPRELARLENKREKYLRMGATVWEAWAHERVVRAYAPDQDQPTIERDMLRFEGLPGLKIDLNVVFRKMPPDSTEG